MIRVRVWLLVSSLVLMPVVLGGCATGVLIGGGEGGEAQAPRPSASDARITAEVNRRLVNDELVPAMDVEVQTRAGVVSLSGRVPTRAAAERALRLARSVPGVRGVRDELRVGR